jgi:hypothetical protein
MYIALIHDNLLAVKGSRMYGMPLLRRSRQMTGIVFCTTVMVRHTLQLSELWASIERGAPQQQALNLAVLVASSRAVVGRRVYSQPHREGWGPKLLPTLPATGHF